MAIQFRAGGCIDVDHGIDAFDRMFSEPGGMEMAGIQGDQLDRGRCCRHGGKAADEDAKNVGFHVHIEFVAKIVRSWPGCNAQLSHRHIPRSARWIIRIISIEHLLKIQSIGRGAVW
jgi:hypothetical protein